MNTIAKAHNCGKEVPVCQGDIYQNVIYSYPTENEYIQFQFPYAIVVSQACDVIAMDNLFRKQSGKATKFMPSILLCPLYYTDAVKDGEYVKDFFQGLEFKLEEDILFNSKERSIIQKNWHYRFYEFNVQVETNEILPEVMVDFKHYFSLPISYLINNSQNRVCCLDGLYAEQITLKFAAFLSRVAIPDNE